MERKTSNPGVGLAVGIAALASLAIVGLLLWGFGTIHKDLADLHKDMASEVHGLRDDVNKLSDQVRSDASDSKQQVGTIAGEQSVTNAKLDDLTATVNAKKTR